MDPNIKRKYLLFGDMVEDRVRNVREGQISESQMTYRKCGLCLQPCHPEQAQSHLISEAKQGQAWIVLGWETT